MHEYVFPVVGAYQLRKEFHSKQRKHDETTEEWFHRIHQSIDDCEFGEFRDFIMIDKFVAGLDAEAFEEYAVVTQMSLEKILSMISKNKLNCEIDFDVKIEPESYPNDHIFPIDNIKLDEDASPNNELAYDSLNSVKNQSQTDIFEHKQYFSKQMEEYILDRQDVDKSETSANLADETIKTEIKGFVRENKIIICLDCGKKFRQKNSYNYHKKIHTGNNLYPCNICGKTFVKQSMLKLHLPSHDQDNKSLECYLCSSKFDRLHGLRIHFTTSHTVKAKRNLQCSICNKAFSKQPDLDLHIKIHRGLVKAHKCQQCGKTYDKRSLLKEHLKVHSNTKEFICETCGLAYKTKCLWKKHMQSHNADRQFKCCECGQILKTATTLVNHMRQHTGERPYECNLCEKNFVTRPSLIKHLRVHRQEKPHGCSLCPKRFATNYHLKVHMNTHTGAKPYQCNQCARAFTQLGTLKAHQLKAHPEEYAC